MLISRLIIFGLLQAFVVGKEATTTSNDYVSLKCPFGWKINRLAFYSVKAESIGGNLGLRLIQTYRNPFAMGCCMELFSRRRSATILAQQSNMYGMMPCMCCITLLVLS